jgi:hypothetical protein
MGRPRRDDDFDRCGWFWAIFDANAADKTWIADGQRTYVSQLALAIHTESPQLSMDVLVGKCEALWEACIE